ncbi:MAG: CYTH domain-containing protein [Candidatus Dependentiae bacterium]|nr:CYTH domain-containing protein [Candidatus Dependentiae bacterium]
MMQVEFEAKFFVNFDKIKTKMKDLGGNPLRSRGLMRRFIFQDKENLNQWIRVRDELEYVALTLKSFDPSAKDSIESVKELEIRVSDFEKTAEIFECLGYKKSLYMENYREIWSLQDCLVMFDELPGIEPFIEIEGPNKHSVEHIVSILGLDIKTAMYGPNSLLYEKKYGITKAEFGGLTEITFACHPGMSSYKK